MNGKTVLAAFVPAVAPAFGQAVTGEILGTATDATGALVADAGVTVRSRQTNIKSETRTITATEHSGCCSYRSARSR
jgi:hypothetical protein